MKIGIITFQMTTNYGAALQCMALTKKMNDLGVDCETIRYSCENIQKRELNECIFTEGITKAPIKIWANIQKKKKAMLISSFLHDNCRLSLESYDKTTIKNANCKYDKFISGSDIIWEMNVTGEDYTYLLDFVDEKDRFAYSSSFGYSELPSTFRENTVNCLKKYKCLSTRENEGANIIKSEIGKDVLVTLDPTLLITGTEWENYEELYKVDGEYIFLYFDDKKHIALNKAIELAKKYKCKVIYLNDSIKKTKGTNDIHNVTVGQFLWLIHHAKYVVTGSYHGVLFSINYNTPFFYYNRAHKSRIDTIINNLEITDKELDERNQVIERFEWEHINFKLDKLREQSIDFLKEMIEL